jgi:hypothetical protein
MFLMLESREDLAKAQQTLEASLKRELPLRKTKDIGYPGGRVADAAVFTDGRYWYWSGSLDADHTQSPRRLNWFGEFNEETGLGITVEINIPNAGRNDRVAGFFARDSRSGVVYLFHSGRVGGGRKGVGKQAFLAWSDQRLQHVVDAMGGCREGILVMPIEGADACRSALRYVRSIVEFKQAVRDGEIETTAFAAKLKRWGEYYSEAWGQRIGKRSAALDYVSRHGEVVEALMRWRKSHGIPRGHRLAKDVLIDLGVYDGRRLTEVFEVKTTADRSDLYAAIGQLLVHGEMAGCRRTLVLPESCDVPIDIRVALTRLGIGVLRYRATPEGVQIELGASG